MNRIRSSLPWTAKNVVRIVRLQGMITAEARPGGRGFNFLKVEKHIEQAFDTKKIKPKAVCLEINSRGGSSVQSSLIFHRIRALSKENDVPVLSFAEDMAASGGYWLALAGDEIFVDPNSIVGNIGALSGTFGMEETIKKLGRYITPILLPPLIYTLLNVRATYRSHAPDTFLQRNFVLPLALAISFPFFMRIKKEQPLPFALSPCPLPSPPQWLPFF